MALKIRMARAGTRNAPYFNIVVADGRAPRDGKYIERLGHYDPQLAKGSAQRVVIHVERVKAWLREGALPSDRVARFLDEKGLWKREARHNPKKGEPSQKTKERLAQNQEKKAQKEKEQAEAPKESQAAQPEQAEQDQQAQQAQQDQQKQEETKDQQAPKDQKAQEEPKS